MTLCVCREIAAMTDAPPKRSSKARLDVVLVERGLAPSRERARALILAGRVLVNEQKVDKPGAAVAADAALRMLGEDQPYVSRGGLKLAAALAHWPIAPSGRVCLDVGASTGGFTDCMLQQGAKQVIGVDTGRDQMAAKLRADPRVHLLEQTNARFLSPAMLPEGIAFFTVDVSFIAASLVLPAVIAAAFPSGPVVQGSPCRNAVVLVKPQFEAGREHVGKGGIVRSPSAQQAAVERVRQTMLACGASNIQTIDSPLLGGDGNREFLLYAGFC
jgi:23S rRNA (cytidine1920-2'-O)/16S rRNA (cytidine1409-2'-O)-methyltransferase